MNTKSFIATLLFICITFGADAKKKKEYPHAEIMVGYNYHKKFLRGSDGIVESDIPFILLANSTGSKFYCPSTEYKDSLKSTPSGRAKENEMFKAAVAAYTEKRDRSVMETVTYRTMLYVTKDIVNSTSTVYDQAGLVNCGYYTEPFSELNWEINEDSTKNVLGYNCIKANIDYHGRKWDVWFTPDIPIQEGPWKFCGLPGLILEASEPSGQHHFTVTGIEKSEREITPVYNAQKYEKMNRKDMLKERRNALENGMSIFRHKQVTILELLTPL